MKNMIYFLIATCSVSCAYKKTNFLLLTSPDEQVAKLLDKVLVPKFNEKIGCKAWQTNRDHIERRTIEIFRDTKETKKETNIFTVGKSADDQIYILEELSFDPKKDLVFIENILLHELGHIMRLKHENNTVMQSPQLVTTLDVAIESLVKTLYEHDKDPCRQKTSKEFDYEN